MEGVQLSQGQSSWPPMLIHLTDSIGTLRRILDEQRLRALNPFGAAHNHLELAASQRVVSFSEIQMVDVERLAGRHGRYGLGFTRTWLQKQGGAPVWYLPRDTPLQQYVFNSVRRLGFRRDPELDHLLWKLTPFIDYPQDGVGAPSTYDWRWEREWRVVGDVPFEAGDIAVLIAPEEQRDEVNHVWLEAGWKSRRGVMPPVIDASWPSSQQDEVLSAATRRVSVAFYREDVPSEYTIDETIDADENFSAAEDDWDDYRKDQEDERAEWSGWLDEMARDDIEDY